MDLSQGSKKLLDLVKQAYEGEVMLPDFQRNFVWSRWDIEELLRSLLENMFVGSFLIQNINPSNPPFKTIPIEGVKQLNPHFSSKASLLILDGQQRLSSMLYALYAPDIPLKWVSTPYVFFIDIRALLEDDVEKSVYSLSKTSREYKSMVDGNKQLVKEVIAQKHIIPVQFLKEDFSDIWYSYYKAAYTDEESKKVRNYIKNVVEYKVLTLDIPLNVKPDEIAILFERINRTGVKLSIFDLLVARFYQFIKLREEWERAVDEKVHIRRYTSGDKRDVTVAYYFLQGMAMKAGMSIKARDMLNIDETTLNETSWHQTVEVVETKVLPRFFDINDYGIGDMKKWSPYAPMLINFIALIQAPAFSLTKFNKWYWSSIFTERYAGSVESKIVKDHKEVVEWFADDTREPDIVKEARQLIDTNFSLKDRDNRGNSVYKGVFNLLFRNHPSDFYNDDTIKFSELDDHHIFPFKFLEKKKYNGNKNTVLNRTLIHSSTNKSIQAKSPHDYLNTMINLHGNNRQIVVNKLQKHFISEEMVDIMDDTDGSKSPEEVQVLFDKFILLREQLIINEIKKLLTT